MSAAECLSCEPPKEMEPCLRSGSEGPFSNFGGGKHGRSCGRGQSYQGGGPRICSLVPGSLSGRENADDLVSLLTDHYSPASQKSLSDCLIHASDKRESWWLQSCVQLPLRRFEEMLTSCAVLGMIAFNRGYCPREDSCKRRRSS